MSILHRRADDDHQHPAISSVWRVTARAMVTVKLGGTIFFTLFATSTCCCIYVARVFSSDATSSIVVVLVSERTSVNLGVNNQLLTVLGLVLGFVITFRTSSAYERYAYDLKTLTAILTRLLMLIRYQDGRKMWTNIIVASRSLAHQVCSMF